MEQNWDAINNLKQRNSPSKQTQMLEDEDEYVEEKEDTGRQMPVKQASDPADIISIDSKGFKVTDFYIDEIIKNIKQQEKQLGLTA